MMNDSVREELQTSVAPVSGQLRDDARSAPAAPPEQIATRPTVSAGAAAPKPVQTASLTASKTSPTLLDFQNKKGTVLPEWRLQVQNAVRQRLGNSPDDLRSDGGHLNGGHTMESKRVPSSAVRPDEPAASIADLSDVDPRLSAALRRISDSRKTFLPGETATKRSEPVATANKSFPFNVVSASPNPPVNAARPNSERHMPSMVTPLRMEKKLDTNKLPLIETVVGPRSEEIAAAKETDVINANAKAPAAFSEPRHDTIEVKRIMIESNHGEEVDDPLELEDEIEDLAPFSMRFNAGLFDLIIGVSVSLVILSPIAFAGGSWLSPAGLMMFVATCLIVLFLYMTVSVGFFGKTLGMRLFSLELVDAEENEYPTIHQAAVSSSLYLLSMVLGGIGFLSVFFNEERRAIHDLLSGTIIVREF